MTTSSTSTFLTTSNQQKLAEYRAMGLEFPVVEGLDIKEVDADFCTVAQYKALSAGAGALVDDTILTFDGEEMVDVRWRVQELVESARLSQPDIRWIVTLAHHTGQTIDLYKGVIVCDLVMDLDFDNVPEDAFAFDPFLKPKGEDHSFYELSKMGRKGEFSPRNLAIQAFKDNKPFMQVSVADLPEWTGGYQKEV